MNIDEIEKKYKSVYPANSTARIYRDIDGNECTLRHLVKKDPEWAQSIMQTMDADISTILAMVRELQRPTNMVSAEAHDAAIELIKQMEKDLAEANLKLASYEFLDGMAGGEHE